MKLLTNVSVKNFNKIARNAKQAARVYAQRFPNRNHPDHKTILCYRTNNREP
jgi:hypothetical protein